MVRTATWSLRPRLGGPLHCRPEYRRGSIRRPLRFALVGVTCSGVQLGCLALGVWLGVAQVAANLLALLCATEVSFALSSAFIWPDRRGQRGWQRQLVTFNLTSVGTNLINESVFAFAAGHLPYLLAGAGGIAVAAPANYLISHYLVFRRPADRRSPARPQQHGMVT